MSIAPGCLDFPVLERGDSDKQQLWLLIPRIKLKHHSKKMMQVSWKKLLGSAREGKWIEYQLKEGPGLECHYSSFKIQISS